MSSVLVRNRLHLPSVWSRIARDHRRAHFGKRTPSLRQLDIHIRAVQSNQETMAGEGNGAYSDRWEAMWSAGLKPGQAFDAECCSPSLQELFSNATELSGLEGKSVFIPGCGRGYDVVAFAKAGAKEVVGLELAPTAVSPRLCPVCKLV
jgi:hypothetical protein